MEQLINKIAKAMRNVTELFDSEAKELAKAALAAIQEDYVLVRKVKYKQYTTEKCLDCNRLIGKLDGIIIYETPLKKMKNCKHTDLIKKI